MNKKQILIVEDEQIVAADIRVSLLRLGYDVCGMAVSGKEAIKKAKETLPDLVLMDILLEGEMDGIEAASIISSRFDIPVVYLTAHADDKTLERAKTTGPYGYILKPFEDRDVHSTVEVALYKYMMERMLKESEERYRNVVENAHDAIYIITPDGLQYANPAFEDLTGRKKGELCKKGFNLKTIIHPDDIKLIQTKTRKESGKKPKSFELRILSKDEKVKIAEAHTVNIGKKREVKEMGILRNITERKQAEAEILKARDKAERALKKLRKVQAQLVQSERLAALGELSAGVAHEINNPLNIISGHAQILLMDENLDPEATEALDIIKKQVDRAAKITNQLLHFSKRTTPETKVIDLNEAVNNSLSLVKHQLRLDNIKTVKQLHPEPVSICGDPAQLQQVLLNLINNASHAMASGGTLTIRTKANDTKAEINITDTGRGIPKENLSKLFEPFFTTKEKGSGLGLSIVYGIIEAHKGSIKADSKVGTGTTFTVTLPRLST